MEIRYNIRKYSQEEAYQKIDNFLDGLVNTYSNMISNPAKEWNDEKNKMDFGFEAKGFVISGNIKLEGEELVLNGKLPFAARLFSGKIEDIVRGQLKELFP